MLTRTSILALLVGGCFLVAAHAVHGAACGDPDGDGIDVIDAANVLRAAFGLSSTCTAAPPADCDVDGSGTIDRDDALDVLRRAVGLTPAHDCLPPLRLTEVARGLDAPLFAGTPEGDPSRLYVVEQSGRIRLVTNGTVAATPFLDLSTQISAGGERGLLGLAFHPEYVTNGRLFVNFTNRDGDTVIAEYRRSTNPDVADSQATRVFFTVEQPFANHNGGMVAFGPDGFLYVGLGDGGGGGDPSNNAQRLDTKLGKILRIDVDAYPAPVAGNVAGGDPDVWDFGLRNPFRFSFDRGTGDLYIGDVGQNAFEEVDFEPRGSGGRNYGWRVTEGNHCFNPPSGCDLTGISLPVVEYSHDDGCSVIGGYVYRGTAIPGLVGRYLYGDFCSNRIWSFIRDGGQITRAVELTDDLDPTHGLGNITSFGEDANGEFYVVDGRNGLVFRIDPE